MRMLSDIDTFSEVVGLIYSAGLDPSRWQDLLNRLRFESGGTATHIFGYDFESGMDLGFVTSGYDDTFLRSYGEHYCHKNVWADGWMRFGSGRPVFSQQMCPQDELMKTEFYNDWVKPQEDLCAGGGVLFHKSGNRMFAFGGNIRKKDEDVLEAFWMRAVDLLTPHLEKAFEMNRRLVGRSFAEDLMASARSGECNAVLVISDSGQLLYASDSAGSHLAKGEIFRCDSLNRVLFVEDEAEETFRRALHTLQVNLVLPALTCKSRTFRSGHRRTYEFVAITGDTQAASDLGIICGVSERCLLVTMTQEASTFSPVREIMQLYRLTQAEADVAMMLADGLSAREIAGQRRAAVTTVRNQVKAAMSKCGVRRQLDLVRIVERWLH